MKLPRGIISVVQIPFHETGEIDLFSLKRLIEETLAAGVDGLLVPAVASEVAYLSGDDRRAILKCVLGEVAQSGFDVPVIAGASANESKECCRLLKEGTDLGASACLLAVPVRCYERPGELVSFFTQATEGVPCPLVVQDLEFNGPGLSLEQMRLLKEVLPQLAGWKIETVPSGQKYTAAREAFGETCHISGGWAVPQFIEALDRGVDAMIPESSMIRVYKAIWHLYETGDRSGAVQLFRSILPILAFANQEIRTSIAFFKRLLRRKGIFDTEMMRWTGFKWDRFSERIADELIEHFLEVERGIPGATRQQVSGKTGRQLK